MVKQLDFRTKDFQFEKHKLEIKKALFAERLPIFKIEYIG